MLLEYLHHPAHCRFVQHRGLQRLAQLRVANQPVQIGCRQTCDRATGVLTEGHRAAVDLMFTHLSPPARFDEGCSM